MGIVEKTQNDFTYIKAHLQNIKCIMISKSIMFHD